MIRTILLRSAANFTTTYSSHTYVSIFHNMEGIESADSSQSSAIDALAWHRNACQAFITELGFEPSQPPSVTESGIPPIVSEFASASREDIDTLLETLSQLIGTYGLSQVVTRHFWPIVPDLLARWVSNVEMEEWERRLSLIATICGSVRGMWK